METVKNTQIDEKITATETESASIESAQMNDTTESNYKENILVHREKLLSTKAFDRYYKKYVIEKK